MAVGGGGGCDTVGMERDSGELIACWHSSLLVPVCPNWSVPSFVHPEARVVYKWAIMRSMGSHSGPPSFYDFYPKAAIEKSFCIYFRNLEVLIILVRPGSLLLMCDCVLGRLQSDTPTFPC